MLNKNDTTFKEDIEASFKKEVATQLQLQNDTMVATIDQSFLSFQSVVLQTIKDLVMNMVPQLSNQQQSKLLSPPPNDMLYTQPPT